MGITPTQFEQMKQRATGKGRVAAPVQTQSLSPAVRRHVVILGIDPSLRGTGYGVIRVTKGKPSYVEAGTVKAPAAWPRSRCLLKISQELRDVVRRHAPTVCVVEGLFYAQNLQTAIIMGEARGAALAAVAESGLEVYELATRKVKQAIVGHGAAQKLAVAKMVQRMLSLAETPAPDAADALALALAHAHEQGRYSLQPAKRL
jgi:crossover junction endodeoxyribonuclease RuvC